MNESDDVYASTNSSIYANQYGLDQYSGEQPSPVLGFWDSRESFSSYLTNQSNSVINRLNYNQIDKEIKVLRNRLDDYKSFLHDIDCIKVRWKRKERQQLGDSIIRQSKGNSKFAGEHSISSRENDSIDQEGDEHPSNAHCEQVCNDNKDRNYFEDVQDKIENENLTYQGISDVEHMPNIEESIEQAEEEKEIDLDYDNKSTIRWIDENSKESLIWPSCDRGNNTCVSYLNQDNTKRRSGEESTGINDICVNNERKLAVNCDEADENKEWVAEKSNNEYDFSTREIANELELNTPDEATNRTDSIKNVKLRIHVSDGDNCDNLTTSRIENVEVRDMMQQSNGTDLDNKECTFVDDIGQSDKEEKHMGVNSTYLSYSGDNNAYSMLHRDDKQYVFTINGNNEEEQVKNVYRNTKYVTVGNGDNEHSVKVRVKMKKVWLKRTSLAMNI